MSQSALQLRTRLPRIATQIREDAVARARLTVVPRKRQKAPRVPFVALVSLLLLGGVIGLLLFNTSMQQASFAATALQDQADTLAARQQTLRMEIDNLRDPQRLAIQAKALGMVPATGAAFIHLPSGRVSGVAVPATRDNALQLLPAPPTKPPALTPRTIVHKVVATGAAARGSGASSGEDGSHKHQQDHQHQSPHHSPRR